MSKRVEIAESGADRRGKGSWIYGGCVTVSAVAAATGGMGKLIKPAVKK